MSDAPILANGAAHATPAPKKGRRHKMQLAHHTPGRVRMKIPSAKGDHEALAQIAKSFAGVVGVESVEVNPTTGSLLLKYDSDRHVDMNAHLGATLGEDYKPPDTELDKLTDSIAREAEFLAQHSHTAAMIVDFFTRLDQEIKRRSHNYIDLKIIAAAIIIVGTVFEVGTAAATPVWLTLVVFSVNHMVQLHQHQLMRAEHNRRDAARGTANGSALAAAAA